MRRTLRDVGRIRAGASDVVLRMSVGVHTGSYAMFLVGGSHRELLIAGPDASTVVAMEGLASAGQILLARRPPSGCHATVPARGWARASSSRVRRRHRNGRLTSVRDAERRGDCRLPAADRARASVRRPRGARAPDGIGRVPAVHPPRPVIAGDGPEPAAHRLDQLVRIVQTPASATRSAFSTPTSRPMAARFA